MFGKWADAVLPDLLLKGAACIKVIEGNPALAIVIYMVLLAGIWRIVNPPNHFTIIVQDQRTAIAQRKKLTVK